MDRQISIIELDESSTHKHDGLRLQVKALLLQEHGILFKAQVL
jgi:hypothetical protein